jgi:hypothetical protein
VVVLTDRRDFVLLWTAYFVQQEHRRATLRKEREGKKQAGAAREDDPVTPSTPWWMSYRAI